MKSIEILLVISISLLVFFQITSLLVSSKYRVLIQSKFENLTLILDDIHLFPFMTFFLSERFRNTIMLLSVGFITTYAISISFLFFRNGLNHSVSFGVLIIPLILIKRLLFNFQEFSKDIQRIINWFLDSKTFVFISKFLIVGIIGQFILYHLVIGFLASFGFSGLGAFRTIIILFITFILTVVSLIQYPLLITFIPVTILFCLSVLLQCLKKSFWIIAEFKDGVISAILLILAIIFGIIKILSLLDFSYLSS